MLIVLHKKIRMNTTLLLIFGYLLCLLGGGQLYMWGKLKNTGDDWMYPKPLLDLRLLADKLNCRYHIVMNSSVLGYSFC